MRKMKRCFLMREAVLFGLRSGAFWAEKRRFSFAGRGFVNKSDSGRLVIMDANEGGSLRLNRRAHLKRREGRRGAAQRGGRRDLRGGGGGGSDALVAEVVLADLLGEELDVEDLGDLGDGAGGAVLEEDVDGVVVDAVHVLLDGGDVGEVAGVGLGDAEGAGYLGAEVGEALLGGRLLEHFDAEDAAVEHVGGEGGEDDVG